MESHSSQLSEYSKQFLKSHDPMAETGIPNRCTSHKEKKKTKTKDKKKPVIVSEGSTAEEDEEPDHNEGICASCDAAAAKKANGTGYCKYCVECRATVSKMFQSAYNYQKKRRAFEKLDSDYTKKARLLREDMIGNMECITKLEAENEELASCIGEEAKSAEAARLEFEDAKKQFIDLL